MMVGPLSYLDVALIAVSSISGLLAMYRGLTRELLAIVSWVVAAGAVLYFVLFHRKLAEDIANQLGTQPQIAQIAVGAVIFLIVLIAVHLITARISDAILDSQIGMVDRLLGFLFGLVRGFVLIVIPYMFYAAFFPNENEHFAWVREAKSLPYIKGTGETIKTVFLRYLPHSLTAPPGEQQGLHIRLKGQDLALACPAVFHICVTRESGGALRS